MEIKKINKNKTVVCDPDCNQVVKTENNFSKGMSNRVTRLTGTN